MRVLIIGTAALHREGIAAALERRLQSCQVECSASIAEAVLDAHRLRPHIGLLELPVDARLSAARAITTASPSTRMVALLEPNEEIDVVTSAGAGIMGWQSLDGHIDELVTVLERVERGEFVCTPFNAGQLARRLALLSNGPAASSRALTPEVDQLTRREREVVCMLERGLSNKEIARALSIELPTVKNHVHSILQKLDVSTRGAAVAAMASRAQGAGQEQHRESLALA